MSRHTDGPSTHTRRLSRALVLIAVLALVPAAPAFSADPATPPTVDAHLQFVVGGVVNGFTSSGEDPVYASMPAELLVSLRGFEGFWDGGERRMGTWATYVSAAGSGPGLFASGEVYEPATTLDMTHALLITNYDGAYGGGSGVYDHWDVEATNPGDPDATTSAAVGAYPDVFQEDGTDLTMNRPDADIVTKGKWRESYCDCWLGGKVLRTWQKWARMTFTIDAIDGQVVAVVMPMAPNRGEAKVKLDGVNQGRFDTYAPTSENRIIMWQTPPLEAGTHTIAVINLATEGRPRIDVDAFLVTWGNVDP